MKTQSAYLTAVNSLAHAATALKPAIVDLGSTADDFEFESIMKVYLQLKSKERQIHTRWIRMDKSDTAY